MNAYAYSDDAMTHPAGASDSNSRAVAEAVDARPVPLDLA